MAALSLAASVAQAQGVPMPGVEAAAQKPDQPVVVAAPPPPVTPAATTPPAAGAPVATPPGGGVLAPTEAESNPFPFHAWEVPAIDVPGVAKTALREEDPVGEYGQPRWQAQRRFPTTRTYVLPKGKVEVEEWFRYTAPFKSPDATSGFGAHREFRQFHEFGFGIGHRLQLDFYLVTQQDGNDGAIEVKREQAEIRYALFDYGKVWGNPALYLEYQHRNGGNDYLEPKILLSGQLASRWHAGFNLVLERELGGSQENEWNVTAGVSYTVIDQQFHVGGEAYAEVHDAEKGRWQFADNEQLFLLGPSFMWSPIPPAHILFSPLFGTGKDGGGDDLVGKFRLWFIFGWAL